jgi:hypothetical protein
VKERMAKVTIERIAYHSNAVVKNHHQRIVLGGNPAQIIEALNNGKKKNKTS